MVSFCNCSMAGTVSCKYCRQNPNAEINDKIKVEIITTKGRDLCKLSPYTVNQED